MRSVYAAHQTGPSGMHMEDTDSLYEACVAIATDKIRDDLERALSDAPESPGTVAPDLNGWRKGSIAICSHCAGRIVARGMGTEINNMEPVWSPKDVSCCLRGCNRNP